MQNLEFLAKIYL